MLIQPPLRSNPPRRRRLGLRGLLVLGFGGCALLLTLRESSATEASSRAFLVIVGAKSPTSVVKRELLADIFLKKTTRWQTNEPAAPVDLRPEAKTREAFSAAILKRPVAAVRQYWTQRIFSGRDLPPPELDSDEAVVRYVANHAGAVGYVSSGADISGAKPLDVR